MLSVFDKKIIRRLQESIPITATPYKDMANELNIDEGDLIDRIKYYNKTGILKRIGAILYHRRVGFKANAMVVWKVNERDINMFGNYMASFSEVSHCCQRKIFSFWNYQLYTMIHAKDREKCNNIIKNISYNTEIVDYKILYSTKELKKTSMKYFVE